jgi:hypothetical protein
MAEGTVVSLKPPAMALAGTRAVAAARAKINDLWVIMHILLSASNAAET